jgi:hypothetical protein
MNDRIAIGSLVAVLVALTPATGAGQATGQGSRSTTKDAFPNGCISCHTSTSKDGDTRMSALMMKWTVAVDPPLMARARASATVPEKVKGKHPPVAKAGANIPQGCLSACHKKGSMIAPAFAMLMHNVHLTGAQNRFVALFQGECTHCHKLDQKTGALTMPSGAEK